ncbi:MAG: acyl-ACP--UDP-N-acetylglucosamine O-acyltransferase, partial [Nitrospinota bacterium]
GTEIGSHAVIEGWTTVGEGCSIGPGAVIGAPPQVAGESGVRSYVRIGDRTVVREYATIHRSKELDGVTSIGNDCYLMAYSHVAHDCRFGDGVILVNLASLSGHVVVEDGAFISGMVAIHQFVRLGTLCLAGALSVIRKDVLPYTIVEGHTPRVRGLNVVGLRRRGVPAETRRALKGALKTLLDGGLRTEEALERIRAEYGDVPEVSHFADFVERSERGVYR